VPGTLSPRRTSPFDEGDIGIGSPSGRKGGERPFSFNEEVHYGDEACPFVMWGRGGLLSLQGKRGDEDRRSGWRCAESRQQKRQHWSPLTSGGEKNFPLYVRGGCYTINRREGGSLFRKEEVTTFYVAKVIHSLKKGKGGRSSLLQGRTLSRPGDNSFFYGRGGDASS